MGYIKVDQDMEWLLEMSWHDHKGYAVHGKLPRIKLHHLVVGYPILKGYEVDHINGDKLDNRRSNLRVVTHAENMKHQRRPLGRSGIRGIVWDNESGKWRVRKGPRFRSIEEAKNALKGELK
jgi:hypothetical protein